ncbi:argininosuccinate lyase [Dehalogenimonas alkenigignens]|uniref:Argininosuccinate lyase n=1 Tax=Dehalogenimonas alkenigignens TaxID=1217799 RepID=A0A0W0GK59_9CHLR|nr:argininosuccinate lyase [Dehalogenimonas alkenigignens]KTB48926.1 argininosuccinate lyase [Dehalogenimonas alkenigignens]PVV82748.1 argininosuccinate lyase [Dehalogenimonas alkenigignens]
MSHVRSRFDKPADELVIKYTTSLPFDWRLYREDIRGSIAHARMLAKQGIIDPEDALAIIKGLVEIELEITDGKFEFKPEMEDIHMAVEARLKAKIGEAAGRLHTARSRNDQVATDLRLYLKDVLTWTIESAKSLQEAFVGLAEKHIGVALPGYTHLQPAQPILLAHHYLAYFEMFQRDRERFTDCLERTDVLPLGSGALAGVAYDIDRGFVARELGFRSISRNSLDAVSDRDFVVEFMAAASLAMMHLSRLSEELVIWSGAEFGFIEIDDAYATGSSIMPQKKNPDVAELCRGKTGRVYGHLMALLTMLKGLPLAYNRDLQEDKEAVFDTADTLLLSLKVVTGMMQTIKVKPDRMLKSVDRSFLLATDLADYLVKRGEVFRNAHGIVGRLVSYCVKEGKTFPELTLDEYRLFSPLFCEDVFELTAGTSIDSKDNPGGTARRRVEEAIAAARTLLEES